MPKERFVPRPVGPLFTTASWTIGIGFVVMVAILLARTALYLWMGLRFESLIADKDFDTVSTATDIDGVFGVVLIVTIPVVTMSWMVWQQQLARCASVTMVRRTPPWHAWTWIIPFANFWMPYQNVVDLWRGVAGRESIAVLRVWWASLFGLWLASTLVTDSWDEVDSVNKVKTATLIAGGTYLYSAAVVGLALYIAVTLTVAGRNRSRAFVSGTASPAG